MNTIDKITAGIPVGHLTVLVGDSGPKTVIRDPMLQVSREVENPGTAAQGFVQRAGDRMYPYRADHPTIDGLLVHFWLGDTTPHDDLILDLARVAFARLEAIRFTYSEGSPAYFESHKMLRAK